MMGKAGSVVKSGSGFFAASDAILLVDTMLLVDAVLFADAIEELAIGKLYCGLHSVSWHPPSPLPPQAANTGKRLANTRPASLDRITLLG